MKSEQTARFTAEFAEERIDGIPGRINPGREPVRYLFSPSPGR